MDIPGSIFLKVATRTPDVFLSVAWETIRSRSARYLDYPFGKGKAPPPRYVDIKLTNRCNLRCPMCGQWGRSGIYKDAPGEVVREEMDLSTLRRIARQVQGFKPMFYLWGGEPFLYGDLLPFLSSLESLGLMCAMNTNGTFLAETAEELVGGSLANILVSVDGPRKVHDRVRGVEGTYDKVMSGVRRLVEAREEQNAPKPYVTFVATVNSDNQHVLPRVYDIAAEAGVDFVGLQFGTFTTEKSGGAYQRIMRESLGCEATSWRGFLSYDRELDFEAIQEGLREIRSRSHPFGTYFVPNFDPEDIPDYYKGTGPVKGRRKCVVPWMRVDLLPNGDVYPCIDFPDYIVGNVHERPLMELWNSERYVKFRRRLQKGLLPICGRCTPLYEF